MIDFRFLEVPEPVLFCRKKKIYDDNIFTFDIETVSLFNIDGEWRPFDYRIPLEVYAENEKVCCPYLWQFGVNDKVYFGREFMDFEKVLKAISDDRCTRFIYVHNLQYEMMFLMNIILKNGWHIVDMCARNVRRPIQFKIEELNIIFRCSYMLTNLSLEKSAEKYTDLKKAVGELDYNVAYSPVCDLPEGALHYAKMDIVTLYHIINDYFLQEYGHVANIPLTQTGEVRRALLHEVDFWYIRKQWQLVPPEKIYISLVDAFMGGITHANAIKANKLWKRGVNCDGIWSYDISSSYPYALTCYKYPSEPFFAIREKDIERLKDTHCILYDVTLTNVESKLNNHYIPFSKIENRWLDHGGKDDHMLCLDNGRVVSVKRCRLIVTDVDLNNIIESYHCEVKYNNIWASFAAYLDKRVQLFILQRYSDKTTLKNTWKDENDNIYAYYMKMKQQLNSCFGMSCTNQLKQGIEFDVNRADDEWVVHQLYDMVDDGNGGLIRFIDKQLSNMRHSYSTLFYYAVGVWCTAYARNNLWGVIKQLDNDVIYYDTDSVKGTDEAVKGVIEAYNNDNMARLKRAAEDNDIDINMYIPADKNGVKYPLGEFSYEDCYKEFKTLGAKKYAYKDKRNKLHITVSGVSKAAAVGLRSLNDFNDDLIFYPECTGKLTHIYNDHQPAFTYTDVQGNRYTCELSHTIVLQPTSYKFSITDEYESYINSLMGILPNDY